MTSISKSHRCNIAVLSLASLLAAMLLLLPQRSYGETVSLSVTPSIIEISAEPGKSWESSIKVINNNPFPLTVYATVVNFVPEGEGGQAAFVVPDPGVRVGTSIAQWLRVSTEPITIERESSTAVPIALNVPEDATPGGHYAAIQIGTKPPETSDDGRLVKTSQIVTSLFFARIAGDVIESGTIRSFRSEDALINRPHASFELRFENKGNVHLQPQGEIVIKNMWGAVRGTIPINQQTRFGNVLPKSIRRFEFTWSGVFSLADIGRYTAEVTLAYGTDARQSVSSKTSFYVVPLKALALTLLIMIAAAYFVRFVIRSYVRRMLYLAGVDPDQGKRVLVPASKLPGRDVRIVGRPKVTAPVRAGYSDLRTRLSNARSLQGMLSTFVTFMVSYRTFFLSAVACLLLLAALVTYIRIVTDDNVPYEVTVDSSGEDLTISSEQILYNRGQIPEAVVNEAVIQEGERVEQEYTLILSNASGQSGVAAALKTKLEATGYMVDELHSDLSGVQERTVIVFDPVLEEQALTLSGELRNALLSASNEKQDERTITVFIGKEYTKE